MKKTYLAFGLITLVVSVGVTSYFWFSQPISDQKAVNFVVEKLSQIKSENGWKLIHLYYDENSTNQYIDLSASGNEVRRYNTTPKTTDYFDPRGNFIYAKKGEWKISEINDVKLSNSGETISIEFIASLTIPEKIKEGMGIDDHTGKLILIKENESWEIQKLEYFYPSGYSSKKINRIEEYLNKSWPVISKWFDAFETAKNTPKLALASNIGRLQDLKSEFEQIETPSVCEEFRKQFVHKMESAEEMFNAFLSGGESAVLAQRLTSGLDKDFAGNPLLEIRTQVAKTGVDVPEELRVSFKDDGKLSEFVTEERNDDTEKQPVTTQQTAPISSGSGSVVATVNFKGQLPEAKIHDTSANDECDRDTIKSREVVINENGTLKNVVLAVKAGPAELNLSPKSVNVDQVNCMFTPKVVTAKVGQTITFKDSDQGMHNVRAEKKGSQLSNIITFQGQSKEMTFQKAGAVSLECDVHPWMQGWVYVTEHGAASVTNESGEATLEELPAGEYTFEFWHEKYGTKTKTVTLEDDENAKVAVSFSG